MMRTTAEWGDGRWVAMYEHFFSNTYGETITMNTFFSNKCITLLIRGSINLLILSTMVVEFIGTPLVTQAHMSQIPQDTNQAFKRFCSFYYKYNQDPKAYQDTEVCQQLSNSFSSVLKQDSPNGYSAWPTVSLYTL